MQINEFIEATARLETYYDKEYTTEQRSIMYEELKNLDITRYRQLISVVLRKCKFMPKLADFNEANIEEPYTTKQEETKIECKKCNGTCYILYTKIIKNGNIDFKNTYVAVCDCGNSKQYKGWEMKDTRNRSNYYTPLAKEIGLL